MYNRYQLDPPQSTQRNGPYQRPVMDSRTYELLLEENGQNISTFIRLFREDENSIIDADKFMNVSIGKNNGDK